MTVTKVNKIEVTNTSSAQKYEFIVENDKGNQIHIIAIQMTGEAGI